VSIIYDALKKIDNKPPNDSPVKPATEKGSRQDKMQPKPVLIYILVILAGLYAANSAFKYFNKPGPKPSTAVLTGITKAIAPTPEPETPKPEAPSQEGEPKAQPQLTLNGVYFQQDEGYALVNNRILKAGDTIEGAKVTEISLDKVILEFDGKAFTLVNTAQ
jgi:type II secretory pathway component PulC